MVSSFVWYFKTYSLVCYYYLFLLLIFYQLLIAGLPSTGSALSVKPTAAKQPAAAAAVGDADADLEARLDNLRRQ
jgi:hypothetical protein